MLTSIKEFFGMIKARAGIIIIAVIAILAYVIDLMSKKNNGLQAQVDEVKDQKSADVMEAKVNQDLAAANATQAQVSSNQAALDALAKKRAELPAQQNLSSQQITEYWRNNP